MAKAFPSIFYIYASRTYKEEVEAYLSAHFESISDLNISNATGIGYKIECYDVGELKALDIELEKYEGWIQQTRRTEFSDVDTEFFDLDKFISGCNKRISFDSSNSSVENKEKIKWRVNANGKTVAVRNINVTSAGTVDGTYEIVLGSDKIAGGVPLGATIDINRVYRKNLNGEFFEVKTTDAYLTGYVIEFKGDEWRRYYLENATISSANFENCRDEDYSTSWDALLTGAGLAGYDDYLTLISPFGEPSKAPPLPYTKLNMVLSFEAASTFNVRVSIHTSMNNDGDVTYNLNVYDAEHTTKSTPIAESDSYITIPLTKEFNNIIINLYLPSPAYAGLATMHIWDMFLS